MGRKAAIAALGLMLASCGGNSGPAGSFVSGFTPDLRKFENRLTFAVLVKM